ncbi:MAG TPA: M24 family metallopeptidase [Anaerolineales bacterium]|nr:M24 family metallopeptidase [Anaerolineales bacterium]
MKSDLDELMRTKGFDAILITGPAQHNPAMVYLTGGAHLTSGDLIKKQGEEPILFYNSMEREEAAKSGLKTKSLDDYKYRELLQQSEGNQLRATVLRYQKMLEDLGLVKSHIAVYGKIDAGSAYAIFSGLENVLPELTITGELTDSVLLQAMATKDESEIERIRKMGQITTEVVENVADYLTSQKAKDDALVKSNGEPVKISDVKSRINLWLAERGAENPEGTIFATGHDAGVPHSSGNSEDALRLGETIVFDIFPCEAGGGYYYDFTRTWCLGYAPDEVQQIYQDVYDVYHQIMGELKANSPCQEYQDRACELFEAKGHPTVKSNPQTEEGYVHGLGHGLGLHVHERPWFGRNSTQDDLLAPGVVVTIEPGLYYPDRGIGVRLEDPVWVRPDGEMEILAKYPLDLVLPVKRY